MSIFVIGHQRIILTGVLPIGSDDGLAPTRGQAIIWTDDGKFTDAYMCIYWFKNQLAHYYPGRIRLASSYPWSLNGQFDPFFPEYDLFP